MASPKSKSPAFPVENLIEMKSSELKTMCEVRGLDDSGTKDERIRRLKANATMKLDWTEAHEFSGYELKIELKVRNLKSWAKKADMIKELKKYDRMLQKRPLRAMDERKRYRDRPARTPTLRDLNEDSDWSCLEESDDEGKKLRTKSINRIKARKGNDELVVNFYRFYKLLKKTRYILNSVSVRAAETQRKHENAVDSDSNTRQTFKSLRKMRRKKKVTKARKSSPERYDLRQPSTGSDNDEHRRQFVLRSIPRRDKKKLKKIRKLLRKQGETIRSFSTQQLRHGTTHLIGIARVLGHAADGMYNSVTLDEDDGADGREVHCLYRQDFGNLKKDEITPEKAILGVFNKKDDVERYVDMSTKGKWGSWPKVLNFDDFFPDVDDDVPMR